MIFEGILGEWFVPGESFSVPVGMMLTVKITLPNPRGEIDHMPITLGPFYGPCAKWAAIAPGKGKLTIVGKSEHTTAFGYPYKSTYTNSVALHGVTMRLELAEKQQQQGTVIVFDGILMGGE